MHKLVILIEALDDWNAFEEAWPRFLHLIESVPGLQRETTSQVEVVLYGHKAFALMHELYFDSLEAARAALASPAGREAGKLLQEISRGRMTLFFADHKEDDLANIRKHRAHEPVPRGS